MSAPLATVRTYDDLIAALRARKDRLRLTDATMDALAGWQSGYTGKLFGPSQVKKLGGLSFELALATLGVRLELVEDPETVAMMERRWEQRARPANVDAHRISETLKRRVLPQIMRDLSKKAADARKAKIRPSTRRRIARLAAKARWRRTKKRVSKRCAD